MIHEKKEWKIPLLILLVFTFFFPGFILSNAEYKIISYKGKVKVKKNNEVKQLKKQLHIYLKKSDAQRELIEDYLFNEFLPIVIVVRPDEERVRSLKGAPTSREIHFNKTFFSNFRLWWAAFFMTAGNSPPEKNSWKII